MACNDWGSDITSIPYAIGNESPLYGSAYDDDITEPDSTGAWYCSDGGYVNNGWTGQDFGAGNGKVVEKYRVCSVNDAVRTYDPKDWTFEGSNTGAWGGEEVVLDTITGESFTQQEWKDYTFSNSTSYRYYRINVTANNGHGTYLIIQEIEMFECQDFNPTDWAHKLILTIDSSKIDQDLTDFPILVTLSSGTGINNRDVTQVFDELTSNDNRKKIAVTTMVSGVETELYVEIERWDNANEEAYLWTKVSTIVSGTDTTLNFYYDSTQTTNSGYIGDTGDNAAKQVWDDDFVGVWHMAQDPNGDVADCMLDSTSYENHGTPAGSMTSEDLVDGKIGKCLDFVTNDYINVADSASLDTMSAEFTAEFIAEFDTVSSEQWLVGKGGGWSRKGFWSEIGVSAGSLRFGMGNGSSELFADNSGFTTDTPYCIAMVYDDLNMRVYSAGSKLPNENTNTYDYVNNYPVRFAGSDGGSLFPLDGRLDEIRFSKTDRSVAWIKATHNSNFNDLISFNVGLFDHADWANTLEITIDSSKVDQDLTDFPVLVPISSSAGISDVDVTAVFDELQYTAKSVILDIADNWGGALAMMCRALEFKSSGTLLQVGNGVSFTSYGTYHSAPYHTDNLFDVTKSKTGVHINNGWQTNAGNTNIRVICVFDTPQNFNEIVINNHHNSGANTEYGIKNTEINISSDAITDTTYGAEISNSTKIFDGQIAQHPASDTVDDQYIELEEQPLDKRIAITATVSGIETECYTEIERWDWTNEQAWLWTKVPTIVSGTDTILNFYYDSTQTTNSGFIGDTGDTPAQNVWDSNFVGVWHMAQDPNGDVANCMLDSTASGTHGTPAGTMTTADLVDGKVGKGLDLDGTDDRVNVTFTPPKPKLTVESLFNVADGGSSIESLLSSDDSAARSWQWRVSATNVLEFIAFISSTPYTISADTSVRTGYHYGAATFDNGIVNIYRDGITDRAAYEGSGILDNGAGISLGARGPNLLEEPADGIIDESRLSNTDRSAAWIKATNYSNWDTFITWEGEETVFYFTNPIPVHQSTVYGTSQTLQLTVTVSGEAESYTYDAAFYDATTSGIIGSTVSGTQSGQSASTTMQTPSGTDYSWYLYATSSGEDDTSSTYSFTNKFKCAGTVKEDGTALSGIPVKLYKRDTGELIGYTTSTGISGTFEIVTGYNEYHYAVALYASTVSGVDPTETNALIYDWLAP